MRLLVFQNYYKLVSSFSLEEVKDTILTYFCVIGSHHSDVEMVFCRLRIGGRISWLEYQTTPRIRRFIGFKLPREEKPELGTFVFSIA